MTTPSTAPTGDEERRRRRGDLLESLRESAELRARLRPRATHLERARDLLRLRTLRG